ncbi:UBX domain-containing protein 1 [Kluyveromyces marxianus]|uniref:UBX domain-containing protein 1 n=2 Tax=Kluyveromyces marxianus TaxID=4911 RepID=W0TG81_KLUMD|nr:UBX domain-containing protein 1 [Kluyveromyces marxianus DMKU3-1042]QGN17921.1 UBX domain-containing protein 1 [Kluyveromyces marxianus]BAO42657.1 UBX domain-containing protein 1 [Kluyveromyces marxianus DMKU3-1042]BAP74034.1 UBX domain-containing protein 1 [Kluyveromyces marxianus]
MSDESIQQFMALTNASANVASDYLKQFEDMEEAVNAYYAAQQGDFEQHDSTEYGAATTAAEGSSHSEGADEDVSYARTLSGQKIAVPRSTPSPSLNKSKSKPKSKIQSFSDMLRGGDDEDEDRNTFAGGETSGLEITDPHANDSNSLIRDLLEKARRGGQRAGEGDDSDGNESNGEKQQHHFTGRGYRLGSDLSAPPMVVEDNTPQESERPKKVTREITFWKEGFQVGDGKLYRYDDPENSFYLKELNQGRAPLQLLDVAFGQEVDVTVYKKLDESYVPPKRKLGGFQGTGKRLGSPIPGDIVQSQSSTPSPAVASESKAATEEPKPEQIGDTSVQIRYASGKREVLRCNSTDTIRFLYQHVKENTEGNRTFTLSHAFPIKSIDAFDSTIKEQDLCNAVVVQRWV